MINLRSTPTLLSIPTLLLLLVVLLAMTEARRAATYYCPPCSCDSDGINFHEQGRCPSCSMKLLEEGHFNNENAILSPDGSRLAFLSTRDGNVEIYTIRTDGTDLKRLTESDQEDKHVSWSPDGSVILFTSYDKNSKTSDIYRMRVDGSDPVNLTRHASWNGLAVMSPDGSQIAFQSNREGGNHDVYLMQADGSDLRRLTTHEAYDGAPSWSEDGKQLYFSSRRDDERATYAINLDGTGLTKQAPEAEAGLASPDGSMTLHVERGDDGTQLVLHHLGQDKTIPLTDTPGFDNIYPSWSADSQWIYFTSDRDEHRDLYAIQPDGSNLIQLTDGSGHNH